MFNFSVNVELLLNAAVVVYPHLKQIASDAAFHYEEVSKDFLDITAKTVKQVSVAWQAAQEAVHSERSYEDCFYEICFSGPTPRQAPETEPEIETEIPAPRQEPEETENPAPEQEDTPEFEIPAPRWEPEETENPAPEQEDTPEFEIPTPRWVEFEFPAPQQENKEVEAEASDFTAPPELKAVAPKRPTTKGFGTPKPIKKAKKEVEKPKQKVSNLALVRYVN